MIFIIYMYNIKQISSFWAQNHKIYKKNINNDTILTYFFLTQSAPISYGQGHT